MSIFNYKITNESLDNSDEEYMTDIAMEELLTVYFYEQLNNEEVEQLIEDVSNQPSTDIILERSIVKLDKKAKSKALYNNALIQIAREENDKLYKILDKIYKLKASIMKKLDKKYKSRALARVKLIQKRAKTNTLKSKIISRLTKGTSSATKSGLIPNNHPKSNVGNIN